MRRVLVVLGILAGIAGILCVVRPWRQGPDPDESRTVRESPRPGEQAGPDARLRGASRQEGELERSPSVGPYRIEGRVLDASDRHVPGVRVTIRRESGEPNRHARARLAASRLVSPDPWAEGAVVQETHSGDDGSFLFRVPEPARYRVRAEVGPPRRSSSALVSFRERAQVAEAILVVDEGTALRGRVVDGEGRGMRAYVSGSMSRRNWHGWRVGEIETSSKDGRFVVENLPDGTWWFAVRLPSGAQWSRLRIELPREDEWTITLGDAVGSVRGRITDGAEQPVAGAVVLVSTKAEGGSRRAVARATSDAEGAYRHDGLPCGRVSKVAVLHDAYPAYEVRARGASWEGARVEPRQVTTIDVRLELGAVLEGRVVDADTNVPLEGADVFVVDEQGVPRSGRTGADGTYRVTAIPPGRHVVVARHATHFFPALADRNRGMQRFVTGPREGLDPPGVLLPVTADRRRLKCDLALRGGCSVRGRVLDPRGEACEGAAVDAVGYSNGAIYTTWGILGLPDSGPLAVSDADGRFLVEGLPPRDAWVLCARCPPHRPGTSGTVRLAPGEPPPEVTIRLEEGATLVGRVLGPDGEGVEAMLTTHERTGQATVVAFDPGRRSLQDGSFRLEGVPTGSCTLLASGPYGLPVKHVVADLRPREVREGIELRFEALARVSGQLLGSRGEPLPGQALQLRPVRGGMPVQTRTDAQGRFVFDRAPLGRVQLRALVRIGRTAEWPSLGEPFESPASGLVFTYDPPPRVVLKGTVRDASGAPVPLCRVVAGAKGATGSSRGRATWDLTSDDATGGRFEREVVGPPPYEVRASFARAADGRPLNLRPRVVVVEDPTSGPVEIRLETGVEVWGRVIDDEGEGVAGVLVRGSPGGVVTKANGRFQLGGFGEDNLELYVDPPDGYLTPAPIVVAAPGDELVVRLESASEIAGEVRGPEGEAVVGAWVYVRWPDARDPHRPARARVDAEGRFRASGIPHGARCRIDVTPGSPELNLVPAVLEGVVAGTTDLVIRLRAGVRITGVVVDPDGHPIKGGQVSTSPVDGRQVTVHSQVQPDGRFVLSGLEPGTWRVHVSPHADELSPTSQEVEAPSSDVRIVLPELRVISGRVVGRVRYEGWWVYLKGSRGSAMGRTLDSNGDFVFHNVAEDTYAIRVGRQGGDQYGLAAGVERGQRGVRIELRTGLVIAGALRDGGGDLLTRGRVHATSDGWEAWAAVTDGHFRLTGLPPGRYQVQGGVVRDDGKIGEMHTLGEVDAGVDDLQCRLP